MVIFLICHFSPCFFCPSHPGLSSLPFNMQNSFPLQGHCKGTFSLCLKTFYTPLHPWLTQSKPHVLREPPVWFRFHVIYADKTTYLLVVNANHRKTPNSRCLNKTKAHFSVMFRSPGLLSGAWNSGLIYNFVALHMAFILKVALRSHTAAGAPAIMSTFPQARRRRRKKGQTSSL